MSRFDKVKITFLDGTEEVHRGYTTIQDGVLHVMDHDGRDHLPSYPLTNIKKWEVTP